MAFNPGRNVGRVSIRVVPDTTKFREELRRQLKTMSDRSSESVIIDKARLDQKKIRDSIRAQMAAMEGVETDIRANVTVDGAKIKRGALRKSIQEQFDLMGDVKVWIRPELHQTSREKFLHDVDSMTEKASNNGVDIGVNAHTAAAAAQLRYTTRPRFVDIFVRIEKKSLATAVSTLAALSGARLTWKWVDDLLSKMKNLDKALPTLIGWTSGITGLIGSIFAATSGLVGIGQGLFTILPAFLVLPGLILNSVASLTVLIVALKNSKEQLAELGGGMNELGDIINKEFWDRARDPIVDLVQGLMPQLRNAFREVSAGVGEFTAALANAFSGELAGGRLESIFGGIAEGWRVLSTGAPAFAGAMVSLSNIAATYTPRLAGWFVRQANTFDNWLSAISNDGRLGDWMETAIDSMYDLWDVVVGVSGVFEGIWKAADQAGSGGLSGFADLMLEWKKVVNSTDFQRGLTAIFRGSYVAMDAFGGAVEAIGRLIADMPMQFERFVGSVGGFLGGLLDEAFTALNNQNVAIGLDGFSAGLTAALDGIKPALGPIAETFGNFLGLLGDLASNLLPTAAAALAELAPTFDILIENIKPILPVLADSLKGVVETLGPALADFARDVAPVLAEALVGMGQILEQVAPILAEILNGLRDLLGVDASTLANKREFEASGMAPKFADYDNIFAYWEDYQKKSQEWLDSRPFAPAISEDVPVDKVKAMVSNWTELLRQEYEGKGQEAAQVMWNGIANMDPAILDQVRANLSTFGVEFQAGGVAAGTQLNMGLTAQMPGIVANLTASGKGVIDGFSGGTSSGMPQVRTNFSGLMTDVGTIARGGVGQMYGIGSNMSTGIALGILSQKTYVSNSLGEVVEAAATHAKKVMSMQSPSKRLRKEIGQMMGAGIGLGILDKKAYVANSLASIVDTGMFDGTGTAGRGAAGGAQVNVTMPMLPGETPAEQRANVVRELRWAMS